MQMHLDPPPFGLTPNGLLPIGLDLPHFDLDVLVQIGVSPNGVISNWGSPNGVSSNWGSPNGSGLEQANSICNKIEEYLPVLA